MSGWIEIATLAGMSDFTLWERPSKASGEWRNFKLERMSGCELPKSSWWFGWNGERLSRSRDAGLPKEHLPEVYGWVISVLRGDKVQPVEAPPEHPRGGA